MQISQSSSFDNIGHRTLQGQEEESRNNIMPSPGNQYQFTAQNKVEYLCESKYK